MNLQRLTLTPSSTERHELRDDLVLEEPLEIRLEYFDGQETLKHSLAVTMRTPGHDEELALGFLLTEGIIGDADCVAEIRGCGPQTEDYATQNIVRVKLCPGTKPVLGKTERNFYATSSCGICGKASLDAVMAAGIAKIARDAVKIPSHTVAEIPQLLRAWQPTFASTGANHGAALLTSTAEVICSREDVGRHNAVDKVIGASALAGENWRKLCANTIMAVSGRAGFELVQKSLVAGIPMMVAIGAPSSLAVDLARRFDMTLVGFVRDNRYNIYSGEWRIHD